MENWILIFGLPRILLYDRGSAFIIIKVANWATEPGITLAPRTDHSPWGNGKVEIQNKHSTQYFRHFFVKKRLKLGVIGTKICFRAYYECKYRHWFYPLSNHLRLKTSNTAFSQARTPH